jgi:hypothetical protein
MALFWEAKPFRLMRNDVLELLSALCYMLEMVKNTTYITLLDPSKRPD